MLIDTHCHLDFPEFDPDRPQVLAAAKAAGVEAMINVGSSLEGSRRAVALSRAYPEVFATVGIHPHDAKACDVAAFAEIEKLGQEPKVVAIGEVGLDFFRNLSEPSAQREVFGRFLALAARTTKPLVVHCRNAESDMLRMLTPEVTKGIPGIVVHCFSGSADFLSACLDMGFFISFTANITYKKAQGLRDLVRSVPLEKMFLETDAPYLSPEGKRGKRNEPANVVEVAREVSRVKGIDVEKVCAQTTKNARQFFQITP
ncbi:MAG: TatD family hydrolase [Candidatus Omnitrophica bacterium]|nr:TatD family hydrolase [Candidatus Omnitrophota bacterium]